MKSLWSPSIYRYVQQHIVDNAGRHDIDFGRESLFINYLSFFSFEHINESYYSEVVNMSCYGGRRNKWEFCLPTLCRAFIRSQRKRLNNSSNTTNLIPSSLLPRVYSPSPRYIARSFGSGVAVTYISLLVPPCPKINQYLGIDIMKHQLYSRTE